MNPLLFAPPFVTLAVAAAMDKTDGFVSSHPDASQWIMGSLLTITCLIIIYMAKNHMAEVKDIKAEVKEQVQRFDRSIKDLMNDFNDQTDKVVGDFDKAMQDLARSVHTIGDRTIRIEQHCEDIHGSKNLLKDKKVTGE